MQRIAFLSFALLLSNAAPALADVIPPEVEPCMGRSAGDACTISGDSGTCAESRCTRLDYGNRDGSGPPSTVEYDCLKCEPGGEPTEPTPESPGASGGCSATGGELGLTGGFFALGLALFSLRRAQARRRRPTKTM